MMSTFPSLRALIDTFLGRVPGKTGRDDTATRMARDADFGDRGERSTQAREPLRKVDLVAELNRIRREGK
jgi:hypothetical protein